MVKYIIASKDDIELLMQIRLEILKEINNLPANYIFNDDLML